MKDRKQIFLAYSFGDYEGVRQYLDTLAGQGWELTGRSGWLTGRLERTQRTELYYDVVPARVQRTRGELEQTVEQRRREGWEPVDTFWGMDIYKSMPCQKPKRPDDFYQQAGEAFADWLKRSILMLGVTAALMLVNWSTLSMERLSYRWYLYDSKAAAVLLLPLIGMLGILFLLWMLYCRFRRCRPHRPSGMAAVRLRGELQLALIACVGLLLVALWLSAIERLWIRLVLFAAFLLVMPVAQLIGRENRKQRILATGAGVFGLFLIAAAMSFLIAPVGGELHAGAENTGLPGIVTSEELDIQPDGVVSARYYSLQDEFLVRQSQYLELWSEQGSFEVQVYDCRMGWIADRLSRDMGLDGQKSGESLVTGAGRERTLWMRRGNRVMELRGSEALAEQEIQEKICSVLAN